MNKMTVVISWDSFIEPCPKEIQMALESYFKGTGFHVRPARIGDIEMLCTCDKCTESRQKRDRGTHDN